jgi:NADH:ubiquinone oxidoreductase subunit E
MKKKRNFASKYFMNKKDDNKEEIHIVYCGTTLCSGKAHENVGF